MDDLFASAVALAEAIHAAIPQQTPKPKRKRPASPRVTFYQFLDAVNDQQHLKRIDFLGGFHIESRYDSYTPTGDGPLRLTYTYSTRVLAATRTPMPGQAEKARRISLAAGVAFVAELAKSIANETSGDEPDECFCAACSAPPCWFCETAEWCEDCGTGVLPDLWDDHLYKHEQGLIATPEKEADR